MPKRMILPTPPNTMSPDPKQAVTELLKYIVDLHRALEREQFTVLSDIPP